MSPARFIADPFAFFADLLREAPGEAYRRLGPLPLWVLCAVAAAGVALLLFGARWRRPLAAAGGAAAGFMAGFAAAGALGLPGGIFPYLGAVLIGVAALLLPPIFPFVLGAQIGAVLGLRLPVPGQGVPAAIIGSLALGGLALLAARLVAACTAGVAGAAVLGAALLGASARWPALSIFEARPLLLAGLLLVVAIAGAAFQAGTAWRAGPSKKRHDEPPSPGATTIGA
jgi:hypothetical protein